MEMAEFGSEDNIPKRNPYLDATIRQYPPLSTARNDYDLPPPYSEMLGQSKIHELRRNASWQAYKEGQKFNRDNPPFEILPPDDHIEYIVTSGGPKAWRILLEESIRHNNLANVLENGLVVQFNGKSDKMVQTNYPFFRPYEGVVSMTDYGGKPYSEKWGKVGDVLGCGYYPQTGIVFFTKNGQRLDNAYMGMKHVWFPTVGVEDEHKIEFNFGGGEKEFQYEEARGTSAAVNNLC
ncbi:211_t:CDS:2 [Acaulospora colombiana]|uniref:211_t:CDS:1 n=1 Tax=Acaulospora colombiana TaxID=27376 RepID=A0ACA9K657_9GLOM|nr:211_t:CDS:2 [Acaulospora colombiana]